MDYWNPEHFSTFDCFFDFLDNNTVSFHFDNERVVFSMIDGKVKLVEKSFTTNKLKSVYDFYHM